MCGKVARRGGEEIRQARWIGWSCELETLSSALMNNGEGAREGGGKKTAMETGGGGDGGGGNEAAMFI